MNRRYFIDIISRSLPFLFLPVVGCSSKNYIEEIISIPYSLSYFVTLNQILTIGKQYLKLFPDEADYSFLKGILYNKADSGIINEYELKVIQNLINKEVRKDYQDDKTIILNGWILSITEARQCALFYLINR